MGAPAQQQQNPQQQIQPAFASVGFGGFAPQPGFQPSSLAPISQDSIPAFQAVPAPSFQTLQIGQQSTNPFRQPMLASGNTGSPMSATPQQLPSTGQSTNPFARPSPQESQSFAAPSMNAPFQPQSPPQPQPVPTSTNPFAKNFGASQNQQQPRPVTAEAVLSQAKGGTNPFRQAAFVNHATGMGWQHNQQPIGGGLDQLDTVPIFPRPAQQTPWQQ
jgi:hypothetical protein